MRARPHSARWLRALPPGGSPRATGARWRAAFDFVSRSFQLRVMVKTPPKSVRSVKRTPLALAGVSWMRAVLSVVLEPAGEYSTDTVPLVTVKTRKPAPFGEAVPLVMVPPVEPTQEPFSPKRLKQLPAVTENIVPSGTTLPIESLIAEKTMVA